MSEEKDFEKLLITLENTRYNTASIAIANFPDDWSRSSMTMNITNYNGYILEEKFIGIHMNKAETIEVRDALTKVIEDMPEEKRSLWII